MFNNEVWSGSISWIKQSVQLIFHFANSTIKHPLYAGLVCLKMDYNNIDQIDVVKLSDWIRRGSNPDHD